MWVDRDAVRETYGEVSWDDDEGPFFYSLRYYAGRGEANDVEIRHEGDNIVFHDPAARSIRIEKLTSSSGRPPPCERPDPDDPTLIRCAMPNVTHALVDLGDGGDRFKATLPTVLTAAQRRIAVDRQSYVYAFGRDGADVMHARAQFVDLYGQGGADRLSGGTQMLLLNGGPGDDELVADGATADANMRGDAGRDTLTGALDGLQNRLYGGADDDVLKGSDTRFRGRPVGGEFADSWVHPGYDYLVGEEGDDELRGLGGFNELVGQQGDDRVFGGPGPDLFRGLYGNDYMDGSTGYNRFMCPYPDHSQPGSPHMELPCDPLLRLSRVTVANRGGVSMAVGCSRVARRGFCTVTAELSGRAPASARAAAVAPRLAWRRVRVRTGTRRVVRLGLSRSARRAVRRAGRMNARLRVTAKGRNVREARQRSLVLRVR